MMNRRLAVRHLTILAGTAALLPGCLSPTQDEQKASYPLRHVAMSAPTTNLNPWEFPHGGKVPYDVQEANPIASRCYVFKEDAMHFVVKDAEHPYVQEKPFDWIRGYQAPGLDIHEMGGVRMGQDPKTSMLNQWHQLHACPNVYVTDGSAMTSTSTQNPSLTYMAFAARAVDHAVREFKKQNLKTT